MTKQEFIEKAEKIYGKKYLYEKTNYINNSTKVIITCPIHGDFIKMPKSFLRGISCPKCGSAKNLKLTTDEFVEKATKIHGNEYDYSKVEYKNALAPVTIICPIHGKFKQIAGNHLKGAKCPKCQKKYMDTEYFVECAKKIHKDKYDYSKVEYKDAFTPVTIVCPTHGEFAQKPREHLNGCGCQKCGNKRVWDSRGRITTEEFIQKAKEIHGDKYDYSKTEYKNKREPVCIICHKKNRKGVEHGEFWQLPSIHLKGCGCKKCRNSHLETMVRVLLEENNIEYKQEKTFSWLRKDKNSPLFLDFYLPEYNVAIECQGIQHFIPLKNNVAKFEKVKWNDTFKKEKCVENGVKILYFTEEIIAKNYTKEEIIYDKNKLLKEIKKC